MNSRPNLTIEQANLSRLIFKACQAVKFSADVKKTIYLQQLNVNILEFLKSIKETSDETKVFIFLLEMLFFKEPLIQKVTIDLIKQYFSHISPNDILKKAEDHKETELRQWMQEVIVRGTSQSINQKLAFVSKQFVDHFDKKAELKLLHLIKLLETKKITIESTDDCKELKETYRKPAKPKEPPNRICNKIKDKKRPNTLIDNPDYLKLFKALNKRTAITEADFIKKTENGLLTVMNHYRNQLIKTLKTTITVKLQSGKTSSVKLALKEKANAIVNLIKLNNLFKIDSMNQTLNLITTEKIRTLAGYHLDLIKLETFIEKEKQSKSLDAKSQSQSIANRK